MTRPNRTDTPAGPARPTDRSRHRRRSVRPDRRPRARAPPTTSPSSRATRGSAATRTPTTSAGRDGSLRIDSGFIVHNEKTYPHLLRLFRELDVPTQPTEMSMSITCEGCGLSYAGGRGPKGMFAQKRRLADPRFIRMLSDVPRFHQAARALLADESQDPTWGEFLAAQGFSDYFVRHFAIPLVACVWSCGDLDATSYPARHLFRFLDHHGMLTVTGSPTWRTVTGGSATYVDRLVERLPDVRKESPVTARDEARRRRRRARARRTHDDLRPCRRRHPRRPGPRPARRRDPRREARPRPRSATPATRPGCTATRRSCRSRARPRPRGTTACRRATPRPPTSPSATG